MLERNGSVLEQPGYTPENKLLLDIGSAFPPIPQSPGKDEAAAALRQIETLIDSFPFVTKADRSVALSAILTALDHHCMATVPMHAFTSPAAGTGKSLLVDVVSTLATGTLMPVVAQGYSDEELEKRLGAMLLAGPLYAAYAGRAYWAMAALAAVGLIASLVLLKERRAQ
jgi:hypothetical protein